MHQKYQALYALTWHYIWVKTRPRVLKYQALNPSGHAATVEDQSNTISLPCVRKSRLPATRPCLVPLFRPSAGKSAIATKPEPLPCLTQRPPSSERNGSLMLRPSFKSSAWSMHSNPRPAFGRPQPKHHSICPTVRSTQTMPRTPFASTGGSRTSSTTRVMSRYVKTPRASEQIQASSRECAASPTIFCGSTNPTRSPKTATPQRSAVSNPVSYTHLRAHETRHDLVCR